MASDTIDAVLGAESRSRPSGTSQLHLVGALPRPELDALAARLAATNGLDPVLTARLVDRHGSEAEAVVALGRELKLLTPLAPDAQNLEAEVAWAARHELALSVDDVLARRTRLAQERPDRGEAFAPRVAKILGHELGWSARRQAQETTAYLASAHREFDVPAAGQAAAVGQPAPEPA